MPPRGPVSTAREKSTRCGVIRAQWPGSAASASSATLAAVGDEIGGGIRAVLGLDQEVERGEPAIARVSSAKMIASDGPAGRPVSMTSASSRLAATTQGLPGPTIFSAGLTVSVP